MLPGLFLNGLVQIAFLCSLASAVNTGPDGAEEASDSGNVLSKSRPEYTKFNKFFVERFYGKKFTGEETPATPNSPEISTPSDIPEMPESQMAPEVENQLENEKSSNASSNSTPVTVVPGGLKALEPEKQAESEQNQLEEEKESNTTSSSIPGPVVPGGETVLEPERQAGSEQIQPEKENESNTTSTSIPAPVISDGEKVLEPENKLEAERPGDGEKMGNSTKVKPTDPEQKMNESSGIKGDAIEETTVRKSTGALSPQNATCPDVQQILAELNQVAPFSDKGVAGKDVSFDAFFAEAASKYASCPGLDVALALLNRTEPKANTHDFVESLQEKTKLSMTHNETVSPQAKTESELAKARVLGGDTGLAKPALDNVKENVEGHANLSASARINVTYEVAMPELAKVPKAPIGSSEPAEGKHVPEMSPHFLQDSSSRSNQEADDALIQGDRIPEETSTLTTTITKYVYAPDTSTLWNTHTSTVCDETSPCATAPAEQFQGPRVEANVASPEPVKPAQAKEIPHVPLGVQKDDIKAEKADSPDQTTDITLTTTITSTVMSKPMSTFNSTVVSTTCTNSTDCASVKTIRPASSHVPASKPIVAYEGKASSLTFGGAMMGALGLVCVFV